MNRNPFKVSDFIVAYPEPGSIKRDKNNLLRQKKK